MIPAEIHPLGGKFGIRLQKGHKVRRKGILPAMGLGADNLICRDFMDAQFYLSRRHVFRKNLVQDLGIGVMSPENRLPVGLPSPLQCLFILFCCFLSAHRTPPMISSDIRSCYYTIFHPR